MSCSQTFVCTDGQHSTSGISTAARSLWVKPFLQSTVLVRDSHADLTAAGVWHATNSARLSLLTSFSHGTTFSCARSLGISARSASTPSRLNFLMDTTSPLAVRTLKIRPLLLSANPICGWSIAADTDKRVSSEPQCARYREPTYSLLAVDELDEPALVRAVPHLEGGFLPLHGYRRPQVFEQRARGRGC
jgi:hypothetical protein